MIQFYIEDTYPNYQVTFFQEAVPMVTLYNIPEDRLDYTVEGFRPEEDKEQIFEAPRC